MKPTKVIVNINPGSDFQNGTIIRVLATTLITLKVFYESQHKETKIDMLWDTQNETSLELLKKLVGPDSIKKLTKN